MPTFSYRGRDGTGTPVDGKLEAPSSDGAATALMGRGITPLAIVEAGPQRSTRRNGGIAALAGARGRLSSDELQMFSRQLHALLRGGLPIMRALGALQESATRPLIGNLLRELIAALDQGREFSAALARHPQHFPPLYVAMVQVGEQTGRLDTVLGQLATWLEFERKSAERVRTALRYPAFVIVAMAAAMVVINLFVVPRFATVYRTMNAELPLLTRVLIAASDFTLQWWWAMAAALVGAALLFRAWVGTDAGRLAWDGLLLRIPIAGRIVRLAALARFARSLAMMLRSGLPAARSVQMVANAVGNAYLAARLERVRTGIERGESLLRGCSAAGAFTPMVLQMIAVGEESGTLDEMLDHVADFYETEVEYALSRLSAAIEPILIVLLGAVVLLLALGVFLPIWDLGRAALGSGA